MEQLVNTFGCLLGYRGLKVGTVKVKNFHQRFRAERLSFKRNSLSFSSARFPLSVSTMCHVRQKNHAKA